MAGGLGKHEPYLICQVQCCFGCQSQSWQSLQALPLPVQTEQSLNFALSLPMHT
jgi:hypothetical protein